VPENRRESTRYTANIETTLIVGEEALEVTITNLSLGGAMIEGVDKLPMDTSVEVTFSIPTHDVPIKVDGVVRWATETGVGVQFSSLRARETWSLNKYFEQISTD
jgi:hypothetical protein